MSTVTSLDRRLFLAGSAAGGLMIALGLPAGPASAQASAAFGSFLRIALDGQVTAVVPCVEMGQGSHTALAMILVDELGADWSHVTIVAPPLGVAYRTPGRPFQNTSGSQMVRRWEAPLRRSAAAAREMLVQVAANQWRVEAAACAVANGEVSHPSSGRKASFGALAGEAAKLAEPKDPILRTTRTLVGKSLPRVDIPAKVNGSAVFGVDVRLPDMVFAAIRQAPVFGSKLVSVDDAKARAMPGVIDVVKLPDAVAVVATSFWRAKSAVEALEPVYSRTAQARISTSDIMKSQQIQLDSPVASVGIESGDVSSIHNVNANLYRADYSVPFIHHATMEPMCCTAHLTDDKFEFWVPTQNHTGVQQVAVKVSGLAADKIVVNATLVGGGFGRKFEQDFVEQAALIAKAVKRPVKLIWTREEDIQHGFYRPAMSARLTADLDPEGFPRAMIMRVVGPSVVEHTIGQPFVSGVDPVAFLGVSTETPQSPSRIQQYAIGTSAANTSISRPTFRLAIGAPSAPRRTASSSRALLMNWRRRPARTLTPIVKDCCGKVPAGLQFSIALRGKRVGKSRLPPDAIGASPSPNALEACSPRSPKSRWSVERRPSIASSVRSIAAGPSILRTSSGRPKAA